MLHWEQNYGMHLWLYIFSELPFPCCNSTKAWRICSGNWQIMNARMSHYYCAVWLLFLAKLFTASGDEADNDLPKTGISFVQSIGSSARSLLCFSSSVIRRRRPIKNATNQTGVQVDANDECTRVTRDASGNLRVMSSNAHSFAKFFSFSVGSVWSMIAFRAHCHRARWTDLTVLVVVVYLIGHSVELPGFIWVSFMDSSGISAVHVYQSKRTHHAV